MILAREWQEEEQRRQRRADGGEDSSSKARGDDSDSDGATADPAASAAHVRAEAASFVVLLLASLIANCQCPRRDVADVGGAQAGVVPGHIRNNRCVHRGGRRPVPALTFPHAFQSWLLFLRLPGPPLATASLPLRQLIYHGLIDALITILEAVHRPVHPPLFHRLPPSAPAPLIQHPSCWCSARPSSTAASTR